MAKKYHSQGASMTKKWFVAKGFSSLHFVGKCNCAYKQNSFREAVFIDKLTGGVQASYFVRRTDAGDAAVFNKLVAASNEDLRHFITTRFQF